ncbi:MAG: hypothetical protein JKY37_25395 [Nannocystaceae bacterium]|nr:hypothetical protein [Nannocystaceae bacterium]
MPEPTDEDLVAVLRAVATDGCLAKHIGLAGTRLSPASQPECSSALPQALGELGEVVHAGAVAASYTASADQELADWIGGQLHHHQARRVVMELVPSADCCGVLEEQLLQRVHLEP